MAYTIEARLAEGFAAVFPATPKARFYRAPGRINLIGEHTDYNQGLVCPAALDLACFVAVAPNTDGMLRVYSENRRELREWRIDDLLNRPAGGDWTDYVIGVAQQLLHAGYAIGPLSLYLASTVPVGAGLSSSAALEVSTALALLGGRGLPPMELALLARRAENEFVGMPCGIMDQYVSVFGCEQAAVRIDCRDLSHVTVPVPESVEILTVNSMVKHELAKSAYAERVRECAAAVETVGRRHPEVRSLRDADPEMLQELESDPALLRRARHVVNENLRVDRFTRAASAGDLQTMGRLFVESHRSLQHDYEISCDELDFLVDTALGLPGVLGARMTGGGFGGCTVNLVEPGQAADFRIAISATYSARYGITPEIYRCRPARGASEIWIG